VNLHNGSLGAAGTHRGGLRMWGMRCAPRSSRRGSNVALSRSVRGSGSAATGRPSRAAAQRPKPPGTDTSAPSTPILATSVMTPSDSPRVGKTTTERVGRGDVRPPGVGPGARPARLGPSVRLGSGRRRVVGALLLGGGFEIEQRDERAGKHPEDGHAGDHDRDTALPPSGGVGHDVAVPRRRRPAMARSG
jgi:hypothetical protein